MPDTEIDIIFPDPIITDVVIDKLGPAGVGVPAGGTTGQRLAKTSNTSFDTQWVDPAVGATSWGDILGVLANQVDLQNALNAKDAVLTFSDSVSRSVNTITLKNDSAAPGASKYYGTDGTSTFGYFALPSGASPANPTATVSGSAVNGAAATFMRSDAAPALANTAVTAGSYGDASHVPGYTVDAQGRLTAASNTAISITASAAGLGNVTNDTQTKAAIVPNTAPAAGQILAGNAGGTAYAPVTLSGSGATATLSSAGVLTLSAIPNATLSNSAITIAGTSTSLGGSITLDTILGFSVGQLSTWAGITPAAGVGTFLATPSSANLRSALTDENGTGAALFSGATSPAFTTPAITTGINDANGNSMLAFTATASAVDGFTFTNAATAGHQVTMAATGSDSNIDLLLSPKGTGAVIIPSNSVLKVASGSMFLDCNLFVTSGGTSGSRNQIGSGGYIFGSTQLLGWTATDAAASRDTALSRNAAGVVEINNGTAGTLADIKVANARIGTALLDTNANSMLAFTATASAVDGFTFTNAATANPATITMAATGSDSNINIALTPKGTGVTSTAFPIANSYAGTASTPALKLSGVPFAGTGTTSFPLLYINDTNATASTTLATAGTSFGVNQHGTSDLMNLMTDGASKFKVASTGAVTGAAGFTIPGNSKYGWAGASIINCTADGNIILSNNAATGFSRLDFQGTSNSASAIGWDAINGLTFQSAAGTSTWNDNSTAASGTVANRYLVGIAAPTLTATNATVTDTVASTVYIGGAPTASTNTTITTPYALNVAAGVSNFGGPIVIGTTTVGALPSTAATGKVTGATATVTDGDASLAWGATVVNTGSGATPYKVWYNGTNWTVVGK